LRARSRGGTNNTQLGSDFCNRGEEVRNASVTLSLVCFFPYHIACGCYLCGRWRRTARPSAPDPCIQDRDTYSDGWRSCEMARADTVTFAGKPLAGHPRRATVYALWDKENLYLAFDVRSSKLQASVRERDGDQLWEDDGVEFLIDALSDRAKGFLPDDFSYHINILNAVYDDRGTPSGQADPVWNGNAQHLARILDDYHYVVQVSIPWAEIGIVPAEGIPLLASISA
jgi:Carbohydrate family 9 binding domain-like